MKHYYTKVFTCLFIDDPCCDQKHPTIHHAIHCELNPRHHFCGKHRIVAKETK